MGKGGRCVVLRILPPSCTDCLEICAPQTPGTLMACSGLYSDCVFLFNQFKILFLPANFYILLVISNLWHQNKMIKAVPLQAWSGPECSMKLRFPDYMTKAQDGGKVVSLTHRPPLPSRNTPGKHFC